LIFHSFATPLFNNSEDKWSVNGYFEQSVYLKWQNQLDDKNSNKDSGQIQGLLVPELGMIFYGELWDDDSSFLFDLSVNAQIYDIYNIQFAPFNLNLNKLYLKFKTGSFGSSMSECIPFRSVLDELEIPEIEWQVGRDELFWGPGYNDSLILSDHMNYDMLKYSGDIDIEQLGFNGGIIHFTKFFSLIDEKWLFGQRFEYSPDDNWFIGLSETALVAISEQWHKYTHFNGQSKKENDINYNIGLDITWIPEQDIKLYGELFFYDLSFWKDLNSYHNKYGLTIGGHWVSIFDREGTDFRLEYTRINQGVYFSDKTGLNYFYQDEPLGHSLGPDADQLLLQIKHRFDEDICLQLAYVHQRHGQGQYGISLASDSKMSNEDGFLSGIIETSDCISTSLTFELYLDWEVTLTGSLENIYNDENQLNNDVQEISLTVEIRYEF